MRRLTATLHVTPELRDRIYANMPKTINSTKINVDDFISAMFDFFVVDLGYNTKDFITMIEDYLKEKTIEEIQQIVN